MVGDPRPSVFDLQKQISDSIKAARAKTGRGRLDEVFNVILLFDNLASRVYEIKARRPPNDPMLRQAEDIVTGLSYELLQMQKEEKTDSPYATFMERYRAIWRENLSLFFFTIFIFAGTSVIGWQIANLAPSYIPVILPQKLMEDIIERHAWFHDLSKGPFFGGLFIAWNNIRVSINTFLGGAILGLGGLVLLAFNGVMLGATMGFCYTHHFHEALTDFIVSHGMLELSIIVAAAFSGFIFGRAFYMRPFRLFRARMAAAATDSGFLLAGILPWLVLAASVEAFISPLDVIPFKGKVMTGIACASLFWLWTFFPSQRSASMKSDAKASVSKNSA